MFEDLLRDLGIESTNSGVSGGDSPEAAGGAIIHSRNPATGEAASRRAYRRECGL